MFKQTKECSELMDIFEKLVLNSLNVYGHQVERDASNYPTEFYCDGQINLLFQAFLHGYQYRKSQE